MIQAIVVKGTTAVRATVIANRTKSDEMGVMKTKLQNGIAHFTFIKKNGELRECWGTTQPNLAKAKTNGNGESRENYCTTAFFDIEKGAWRSFRWESLVEVF